MADVTIVIDGGLSYQQTGAALSAFEMSTRVKTRLNKGESLDLTLDNGVQVVVPAHAVRAVEIADTRKREG